MDFLDFQHYRPESVENVESSRKVNFRIDINHHCTFVVVVRCRHNLSPDIAIFFKHVNCLVKLCGVAKKLAPALPIKVVLADISYPA